MVASIVGDVYASGNGSSTSNLIYPASIAAGDTIFVGCLNNNGASGVPTTPTGFTQEGSDHVYSASMMIRVWKKTAAGTESGAVPTAWVGTSRTFWFVVVIPASYTYRGISWYDQASLTVATANVPTYSHTGADVFFTVGFERGSSPSTAYTTTPSGLIEAMFGSGSGACSGGLAKTETPDYDGTVGSGSWVTNSAASAGRCAMTVVATLPRVTKTVAASWDVATPYTRVTKTVASSWDVRARVAKTSAASWNVRSRVAKTSATTWDVRARVAKTSATSWNVYTRVAKTQAASWDVTGRVLKTSAASWDVRSRVAKTSASSWDTRARVAKTSATSWNVYSRVAKTSATSWDVRSRVAKTVAASWDVDADPGVTRVEKTQATSWDVRSRVIKTAASSWDVSARVAKTSASSWDVRSRVAKTQVASWDVRTRVSKTVGASWDVRSRVAKTSASSWNLRARVAKTSAASWNVSARVAKTSAASWDTRTRVAKTAACSWNMASPVSEATWPAIIAHRGGDPGPEETKFAYDTTFGKSPNFWFEGDMQVLDDNTTVVLCHDDTINRTASASSPITTGNVSDLSPAEWATVLFKVNSGYTGSDRPAAFMSDLVTAYGPGSGNSPVMLWENKVGTPIATALASIVTLKSQTIVNGNTLSDVQAAVAAGFEGCHQTDSPNFATLVSSGIKYIAVSMAGMTGTIGTDAHANGIKVLIYTVNSTANRDVMIALGGDGFITNKPQTISGTTRATKTQATSWDVRARVTKTVAASWNVSSRVVKTSGTSWDVRSRVAKTQAESWNTLARVAKASATSWDVRSRVAKTSATSWDVRSRVSKTAASSWNVQSRVTKTAAASWDVRTRVQKTTAASWDLYTRTTKTHVATWDVRARVAKTVLASWDVHARPGKTQGISWDTRARVSKTQAASWDVRSRVVKTQAASWDLQARIIKTSAVSWDVASALFHVQKTHAVSWDVAARVVSTHSASWDTGARVSKTQPVTWDTRQRASKSLSVAWNVTSRVTKTSLASWSVFARVAKALAATWDVRARGIKTRVVTWDIVVVQITITMRIRIEHEAAWDVRARVAKTHATMWDDYIRLVKVLVALWDVDRDAPVQVPSEVWSMESYPLALVQGETFERAFRWFLQSDPEDEGTRVAIDLSLYTFAAQVRQSESVLSPLLLDLAEYITVESSGVPATGSDGLPVEDGVITPNDRLRLYIDADVTAALDWRKGFKKETAAWDMFVEYNDDPTLRRLVAEGPATLNPASTQTLESV